MRTKEEFEKAILIISRIAAQAQEMNEETTRVNALVAKDMLLWAMGQPSKFDSFFRSRTKPEWVQ